MDAQILLAGPRGRRLLFAIAHQLDQQIWTFGVTAAWAPDDLAARTAFCEAIAAVVPTASPRLAVALGRFGLDPLRESVDRAMYWQSPDVEDTLLARPEVVSALSPLAIAVAEEPSAEWWYSPLAPEHQRVVLFDNPGNEIPPTSWDFDGRLARWRTVTVAGEEDRAPALTRPLTDRISGSWWSTPAFTDLPVTTRELPLAGAVRLTLVEDGFGWTDAEVTPVAVTAEPRILEIVGPEDWVGLVERYPIDVTRSRRHDWWEATGVEARCFIPDWQAASADLDGVHFTVAGYLAIAGRALRVTNGYTVLAGFAPDETYWLGPVVERSGPAERWHRDLNNEAWERSTDGS